MIKFNTDLVYYLSGPMTGLPKFNHPRFNAVAKILRKKGLLIINPAEQDKGSSDKPRSFYMRHDIKELLKCDGIILLAGWKSSKGALLEVSIGQELGLLFYDEFLNLVSPERLEVSSNKTDLPRDVEWNTTVEDEYKKDDSGLPDSGSRTKFATGAVRDAMEGKGLPHLIALRAIAKLYEDGAKKYGRHNWSKGVDLSRYQDAIMRHTLQAAEGLTDQNHLASIMWNAAGWMWTEDQIKKGNLPKELDDLPYRIESLTIEKESLE